MVLNGVGQCAGADHNEDISNTKTSMGPNRRSLTGLDHEKLKNIVMRTSRRTDITTLYRITPTSEAVYELLDDAEDPG